MRCFSIYTDELTSRLDCYFNYAAKHNTLKSSFPQLPLFELVKSQTGGTPSKDKPEYWNGTIPWASPKDFKSHHLADTEDHISELGLNNSSAKLIPANSILVVVRSGILSHSLPVAVTQKPMAINQDIRALIPTEAKIATEYLAIYLSTFSKQLLPLITKHSTTVQSINTDQFAKIKIPLPPLSVQNQIVEIMRSASEQKRQKEQEAEQQLNSINDYVLKELGIARPQVKERTCFSVAESEARGKRLDPKKYSDIPKAILKSIRASSFKQKPLSELIINDIAGEWGEDPNTTEENGEFVLCNVLRNTNFDNQLNLNFDDVAQRLIAKDKLARIALKQGDILIEKSGGSPTQPVGRIALIEKISSAYAFSNFLQCIRVNEQESLSAYVFAYLRALYGLNYMEYLQNQTTGIKNLIGEEFRAIPVPLPSLSVQQRIAAEVKKRMAVAEKLRSEARACGDEATQRVEKLILG